jgi:type I restriction enzyme S subunit
MVRLGDVLYYEQPTKYIVEDTHYSNNYKVPVLTAGQTFVLGYTSETNNIYRENLPCVIFDDFTTAVKFVDFPFKVKSSAMKILNNNKTLTDIRFLYYYLTTIKIDVELHKRYWISQFADIDIFLPELPEQKEIANRLDKIVNLINLRKQQIMKFDLLVKSQFIANNFNEAVIA